MKVLFIASGNKNGKPGAVVQNQTESLKNAGLDIDFFLVKGKGFKGYLNHILPLLKYLKRHNYDVIHSHYSLSALVTTMALWFFSRHRHIVSLMGSDTQTKGIYKQIIRFCSRYFWHQVIVKSESMKKDIGIENAIVIPNGVDLQKIKNLESQQESKQNQQTLGGKERILFAADPERYSKNIPLAQKAVEVVGKEIWTIYNKSHEEIIKAILKTDILLLTSRWEGSPNIIKEAMACNCPVVATDVGDIKWLFGNEPGHFLTTFNPEDVAAKIEKALAFAREHGRTNGRKRILSLGLDAGAVAERIVGVYEEAMGSTK